VYHRQYLGINTRILSSNIFLLYYRFTSFVLTIIVCCSQLVMRKSKWLDNLRKSTLTFISYMDKAMLIPRFGTLSQTRIKHISTTLTERLYRQKSLLKITTLTCLFWESVASPLLILTAAVDSIFEDSCTIGIIGVIVLSLVSMRRRAMNDSNGNLMKRMANLSRV
jgi:hypothetical protein